MQMNLAYYNDVAIEDYRNTGDRRWWEHEGGRGMMHVIKGVCAKDRWVVDGDEMAA